MREASRFRRLFVATGLSSVGDGMLLVALPLLALTMTRDPLAVAGVVVAGRLPVVLVALPSGALADRVDRRRFLLLLEGGRLLVVGAFAAAVALGVARLPLLYLTAFAVGGLTSAFDVVSAAALPTMVPAEDLVGANARLLSADLAGEELVGQGLGGAAFALARTVPFVADAASFAVSAALLAGSVPANEPDPRRGSFRADLAGGLRWFVTDRLMRSLVAVVATLAFCQATVLAVLPLYATRSLGLGAAGYGMWLAVAGAANLVGGTIAQRVHRRLGGRRALVGAAVLAAVAYPVMASTHDPIVACAALGLEAAAVVVGNVAARTLRQSSAPEGMQGRAASAYQAVVLTALPVGSLAGGLLTSAVGVAYTYWTAGAAQLVVLGLLGRRLVATPAAAAEVPAEEPRTGITVPQPAGTGV